MGTGLPGKSSGRGTKQGLGGLVATDAVMGEAAPGSLLWSEGSYDVFFL